MFIQIITVGNNIISYTKIYNLELEDCDLVLSIEL